MSAADVIDAHYRAYADNDLDGVLDSLAPDFVCAAYNGETWASGREAAKRVYARNLAAYPMALTEVLGQISFGDHVIKRERSKPAVDGAPALEALAIYTVKEGLIDRLDMVTQTQDDDTASGRAQQQLEAYNAQDLDLFCDCFSKDVRVADYLGETRLSGADAFRSHYGSMFEKFPENRVKLLSRLSLGDLAVDHESVMRSASEEPFQAVAIYTVADGRISTVDFIR